MKKKIVYVLVLVVLASINLLGCSNTEGNEENSSNKVETNNLKNKNLKMLSNNTTQNGCGTEDGYYTLSNTEDEDKNTVTNLMYVDYKTKKQIYLCDKSECSHDNDKCTSYIGSEFFGGNNSLICDGRYLYFISSESDNAGAIGTSIYYGNDGVETTSKPASIYRINLDGSNRILLSTFDSGEIIGERILSDGENIYLISMNNTNVKTGDNTSYTKGDKYKLIKVSSENGEKEEISEWNKDWDILGCYQNNLIVRKLEFDRELTQEEKMDQKKYEQACKNAKESITSYNMNTNEFEELFKTEMSEGYYYFIEKENIFYYKYKSDKIMNFDLNTKQESNFIETNNSNIEQIYDGYMITSNWNDDNREYYSIRIKDKEISKLSMYKDNGALVNIIGESKDNFLVENNCKTKNEYVEWAGVNQTIETDREYSIISKEDYFNNKKNFKKVSTLVEEMY